MLPQSRLWPRLGFWVFINSFRRLFVRHQMGFPWANSTAIRSSVSSWHIAVSCFTDFSFSNELQTMEEEGRLGLTHFMSLFSGRISWLCCEISILLPFAVLLVYVFSRAQKLFVFCNMTSDRLHTFEPQFRSAKPEKVWFTVLQRRLLLVISSHAGPQSPKIMLSHFGSASACNEGMCFLSVISYFMSQTAIPHA
jgi:hypothetical protein